MVPIEIAIVALLLIMIYWIGAIFYAMQKGFGEVIKGLESIDDKLSRLLEKK